MEGEIPAVLSVIIDFLEALDYQIYWPTQTSPLYDKPVSGYIVKKLKYAK